MAEGQGMRVGEVVSVSEGERDGLFSEFQDKSLLHRYSANVVPMPLEPGSIQVSATVTVVFALKTR